MAGDNNDNDSNQEELKQLIQKRGQIKAALTRFKTLFDSFQDNGSLTELKKRLKRADKCMFEYETIQSQVELLDNSGAHEGDRDTFETLYYEITCQAEEFIHSKTPSLQNPLTPDNNPITTNTSNDTPQVRLPSISIPTFSGNYEDWISFSDSFTALIHDNNTLNDIQKLHYLKSSLKNEAAKVINSLELSATNYTVAWKLLENRYKNLRLIVERHVKALFDLPTIEKESPMTLRQLLDSTLTHMRALGALEQPTDHWDTLIVHLVKTRLPSTTYRDWENSTVFNELPKLNHLTDFLERRCHILENSSKQYNTSRPINNVTQTKSSTKQNCFFSQEVVCRFCQGKHTIYKCEKLVITPHEDRIQILKSAGLCFNCLRPGHIVTQCTLGGCRKCNRKHNTLLHNTHSKPTSDKLQERENLVCNENVTVHSCHNSTETFQGTQVLLSTAIVDVVGPYGHTVQCRALLDSGSQSSFISEDIAHQLCLSTQDQLITVVGLNGNHINAESSVHATIRSRVSSYSASLQFLVVPQITGSIPAHKLNIQKFKIPHNVVLADPTFSNPGPIDLLIGQELFFDLMCIGQIKSSGLPTIQKTRLGWIIGGRYSADKPVSTSVCHLAIEENTGKLLQPFLKEQDAHKPLVSDIQLSEPITNTKEEVVPIPRRDRQTELQEPREIDFMKFEPTETRLDTYPKLIEEHPQVNTTRHDSLEDSYEETFEDMPCSSFSKDGLIRVGGHRFYSRGHHILLPMRHRTTELAVTEDDIIQLHCEYQELLYKIRQHNLRRITENALLTSEEAMPVQTQVEASLNFQASNHPSNYPYQGFLNPNFSLTSGSLTALPESSLMLSLENCFFRWQQVQQLTQHFWKVPRSAVAEGSVVVLKEDNTPPLSWPLGRVIHLHPGRDGLTRVATIKTLSGEVKRCVNKLCPLPIDN